MNPFPRSSVAHRARAFLAFLAGTALISSPVLCEDWQVEVVDSEGEVGLDVSLAAGADGHLHASYVDNTEGELQYALKDHAGWHRTVIEAGSLQAGAGTSIALDAEGWPHIAYRGAYDTLVHAWQDSSGWHSEVVDSERSAYMCIAFAPDGWPHISYFRHGSGGLGHAWQDEAGWHLEVVERSLGRFSSLAFDREGAPHISYEGSVRHAWHDNGQWLTETVDQAGSGITSLVFDPQGWPHIAYEGPGVMHAWQDEEGWHNEFVDSGKDSPSLAFDSSGVLHASYHDAGNTLLMHAWLDETGWHSEDVAPQDGSTNVACTSLAVAPGHFLELHIAYYSAGDLMHAWKADCVLTEAPLTEPYCWGPLFGRPESGYPGWVWFSIPLGPDDCCDEGNCHDPNVLLGFSCGGRLWYWDRYGKTAQVYQPPFLQWDLAVGDGYLLYLESDVENPSYYGLVPDTGLELKLGREGWVWLGMPGFEELGYPDFMNNVRVQYPVGGNTRTADEDYDETPDNWVQWGWAFWDTYNQAARTFTPYSGFGSNTCYPWIGYRLYVNVGTARSEDDSDQVTLIWP